MKMYRLIGFLNWASFALTGGNEGDGRPKIVQGIINLFTDAAGYLIGISAVAALVFGVFFGLKWYTAGENDKPAAEKRLKHVVIGAVLVISFEGILSWVLSYFV